MTCFNDLISEIRVRDMIFEECLVVGDIYPYSISDRDDTAQELTGCDLPTVALCQVSKSIRDQAEPILYQRNNVIVGYAESSQKFFERCLHTPERKSWLKSVTTWLNREDSEEADREAVLDIEFAMRRVDLLVPKREDFEYSEQTNAILHRAYKENLGETIWPRKMAPLLDYCSLEKLKVDFQCSECPAGCCKMRGNAVQSFNKGFAMGLPTVFEIDGFKGVDRAATWMYIRRWTEKRIKKILEDRRPGHDVA